MEREDYLQRFTTSDGYQVCVWGDEDAASLTFGPIGCSSRIQLSSVDCERLRVLLAEVVAQMQIAEAA